MPLILSNDDGVHADGLATLHAVLQRYSACVVVAPSGPQSGVGHAVTTETPLLLESVGPGRFGLSGTPADCARVALAKQAAFVRAELGLTSPPGELWLVSGINHGANLGVDTYISGTAAAAREAAILGYSAIAISQYVGRHRRVDWEATARRARRVFDHLLERRPRPGHFWNVNLPHPVEESAAEAAGQEIVHCPLDPSPHAFEFETRDGALHWVSDYHNRPRRPGHDVDVCLSGRIAITEIPIQPGYEHA